jgi:hypothetical protein
MHREREMGVPMQVICESVGWRSEVGSEASDGYGGLRSAAKQVTDMEAVI